VPIVAGKKWLPGQFRSASPHLDHPRHIPTAFRAQTLQHQVPTHDCPGEIGDSDLMAALDAPDVGQQKLLGGGEELEVRVRNESGPFSLLLAAVHQHVLVLISSTWQKPSQ